MCKMKSLIKTTLLLLALLMLPATAVAYDFEVDGIYYNINGNEATVTSGTSQYSGGVTIPAAVTYNGTAYSVTAIDDHAFFDCSRLTRVTIPSSVTAIGLQAFAYCKSLSNITVDNGNPKYDSRNNCNAIIETANNKLIIGCENTIIPNSVTAIGKGAFEGREGLMSVDIPTSVTYIGDDAFWDCGLISLNVPKTVTFIGEGAFLACDDLTSVIVDSDNPIYDSRNNCNAIIETATNTLLEGFKSTVIPNTVTAIGKSAFDCCFGLTNLNIPNSVTSIGDFAFFHCSHLTSVIIPNSVTFIGKRPFDLCYDLTSIIVDSDNPKYDSRNNCNAIIETASNTLIVGCETSTIPNSVTSIGDYAFHLCSDLINIDIPNSVISIGNGAFEYCYNLKSMTIGNSVTSIGINAFDRCNSLSDVYCFINNPSAVSMGNSVFRLNSSDYSGRTLHVPHGTADAYQADEHWYPYFGHIVEMESETGLIGDVNLDGEVDLADINAVVDIITGSSDYTITADVNGDGEINISDVNAIINIIHEDEALIDEHEWVDLGLPSGTLWATCNVGASAPEEYGDYFAWGETEPKDYYDWSNYKWCNGSLNSLTKYCTKSIYGTVDGKTELDLDDDAANVNWGSSWCMPTLEQMQELCDSCTWQWTTLNGVMGRLVIGPNGNSIFLPASGGFSSHVFNDGSFGYYWTRTLCSPDKWDIPNEGEGPDDAYIQFFGSSRKHVWFDRRCDGQTIRAVRATPTEVRSLYIEQQSLDLGVMPVETTRTGELTIVNNTSLVQNLTVSIDEPFLLKQEQGTASSMTIEVPANSRSTVTVMFTATAPGEFNGTAIFLNPALDGGQCVIPVQAQSIPQCDYVDLGLPSGTLWATCNVGANAPEEYGDHFAWGETESKEVYKWETYKWCNGSDHSLTKYCTNSDFGSVDNRMVLDLEDDAAYVNMGPSWRMPTNSQQTELIQKCTWQWTTMNGVNGRLVTGPNGNSIFLPAAGERFYNSLLDAGSMSEYWSCELGLGSSICAYGIGFESDSLYWISGARAFGRSVRAVRVPQE